MAKKIVAPEPCIGCGGDGFVLGAPEDEAESPVPCPMCSPRKITKPRSPDDV